MKIERAKLKKRYKYLFPGEKFWDRGEEHTKAESLGSVEDGSYAIFDGYRITKRFEPDDIVDVEPEDNGEYVCIRELDSFPSIVEFQSSVGTIRAGSIVMVLKGAKGDGSLDCLLLTFGKSLNDSIRGDSFWLPVNSEAKVKVYPDAKLSLGLPRTKGEVQA